MYSIREKIIPKTTHDLEKCIFLQLTLISFIDDTKIALHLKDNGGKRWFFVCVNRLSVLSNYTLLNFINQNQAVEKVLRDSQGTSAFHSSTEEQKDK